MTGNAGRRWAVLLPVAAVGVALLVPVTVLLGTAFVMGWKFQPIETGSMAPRYPVGSLAIVEPIDPADVRAGMTVVFEDPLVRGRLVAHRVVKRLPGTSPTWETKGDANAERDPAPVHAHAVQGRVRWAIPGFGRVVSAVDRRLALLLLVGFPLAALLVTEAAARRRRRRATPVVLSARRSSRADSGAA
jgi:signal peptidase I